ncbi:MAG: efflux RND transporter periplasmic adaptor subunit [Anaerolineales bacterium]|jgi:HlyD family secretion protein
MRSKLSLSLVLALALAGCGGIGGSSAPAVPTLVLSTPVASLAPGTGGATASGIVVAAREAQLAFTVGGRVTDVPAALGEQVEAGQVLVELDPAASQRELDQAQRNLAELTSPGAIANAQLAVAQARKAFDDAQTNYNNVVVNYQKGALLDAQDSLAKATARYQYVASHHDPGVSGLVQVQLAYLDYIHALQTEQKAESDYLAKQSSGLGASQSTVDIITGQYEVAKANLAEAQDYLSAVSGGEVPLGATGAQLTELGNARRQLAAAQDQVAATRLIAPFSGTVTAVNVVVGENAAPGEILIGLTDVSRLHVETTDLSEREVPQVRIGQTVTVVLKDLNQYVTGRVSAISPLASTLGGDVVYKATIDLDTQPDALRAGMSVDVNFGTGQ